MKLRKIAHFQILKIWKTENSINFELYKLSYIFSEIEYFLSSYAAKSNGYQSFNIQRHNFWAPINFRAIDKFIAQPKKL